MSDHGKRRVLLRLGLLLALLLPQALHAGDGSEPRVILISLDGTRPADVTRETLPSLVTLGDRGAVAERLIPVSPTNTFPNHVTLVTGVAPERHGLVNNRFLDPERGVFDRKEIASWIEVEPLWSMLEGAGVPCASYYWVGSERPWPGGRGPRHAKRFSSRTPESEKVEQILAWLDLPREESPRFITSWFHGADHAGHDHGPGSDAVRRALLRQDPSIAALIRGIGERGLWSSTTLIFVSDHGMVTAAREVDLDAVLEGAGMDARVFGIGGFATVSLRESDRREPVRVEQALAAVRAAGLEAHRRTEAPASWRVGHVRFGDLVVRAPVGTAIRHARLDITGFHGYDPSEPSMAAIFVAAGRGVEAGTRLPAVRGLDVAPTVLALLGLSVPEWMEGRPIAAIVPPAAASATLAPPGGRVGAAGAPLD